MNIKRKLSFAVLVLGITFSTAVVGCSATPTAAVEKVQLEQVVEEQSVITASDDVTVTFPRSEVVTVAAPPKPEETLDPVNIVVRKESTKPATPLVPVAQAPAAPAAPVVEAAPAVSREVYVGLAGGQSVVDLGRGPVLFPLPGGFPPYVAEHDSLGGWQRFGTLSSGMTVRLSGLVTGTYTVGQIINVPKGGTTDEFRQFAAMPKVMLQTCVPGTNRMIVVGLY